LVTYRGEHRLGAFKNNAEEYWMCSVRIGQALDLVKTMMNLQSGRYEVFRVENSSLFGMFYLVNW
jgi:hypothetical protein